MPSYHVRAWFTILSSVRFRQDLSLKMVPRGTPFKDKELHVPPKFWTFLVKLQIKFREVQELTESEGKERF